MTDWQIETLIFAPAVKRAKEFERSVSRTDDLESIADEPIYEPDRTEWPSESQFVREWSERFGWTPEYARQITGNKMALPSTKQATDELALFARQLQQVTVASQGLFAALRAGIQSIQTQIVSFVEKANPAAVIKFKFAVEDLQGVIGRALTPVLINLTALIQTLADHFNALGPGAKVLIAGLTAAAVGFTVVTVAVIALNTAFATLTGGLSVILVAIGSLIAGLFVAGSTTDALRNATNQILTPLNLILSMIGDMASNLVSVLMPAIQTVFDMIAIGISLFIPAIAQMTRMVGLMAAIIRAVFEFVTEVLGIVIPQMAGPAKAPAAVRPAQIGGLSDFLSRQMVTALERQGGKVDALQVGQGIAKDVAECKKWLERIFGKPAEIRQEIGNAIAGGAGGALGNVAAGGGFGIFGVAAALAARVVGK